MKLLKLSRVSLKIVCLLSFLNTVASYVYTACAEEGDTCSSGYHAIECCDTSHECEQHWKYTYFKCVPQVRRDPLPRKKVKMPRKRPPKSIWDDEKTMYDVRPEISEEIMEILRNSGQNPKNIISNNNHQRPYPDGKSMSKFNRFKQNPYHKYKKEQYNRHQIKLRSQFMRDKPPPEIHPSKKVKGRNKRGNPQTIMTFTI